MEDPRGLGARELIPRVGRRRFLGRGLLVFAGATASTWLGAGSSTLLGAGRRLWAQATAPLRYRPLSRPAVVPLADLSAPFRARQFVASAVTLASAAKPNEPIRISGFVVRTAANDNQPDRFSAVCMRCPHEGCDVDFLADPRKLPDEVVQEIGHPVTEPLYLCPCHNSTFKAENGERLGGPAPRGLYRFRVTSVTDTGVEIGEVEEDLLIFV